MLHGLPPFAGPLNHLGYRRDYWAGCERHIPFTEERPMFRKTILAIAAFATVSAFAATSASAGYYGHGYGYKSYGYGYSHYQPYYGYGYRYGY
jgi:hypothetical protein